MIRINEHYRKLKASYLFSDIGRRVEAFQKDNPDARVIKLGIGDVTRALPDACIHAFHRAVDEMGRDETFRGYGPEQGYPFLRERIAENDYRSRGASVDPDEIFISDGSKCDVGNFQELFALDATVAIPDPVYPVYVDTNVMAGRTGESVNGRYEGIVYMDATEENGFVPEPPEQPVDLIYLCYPNNPTGSVAPHDKLAAWIDYAKEHKALILYDAAYHAFIRDDAVPRSIYEVPGAREVAVEFRSFSKSAGFTGTRCAFTVIPKECRGYTAEGEPVALRDLWNRRHSTKFNGVSYPVQRAAEAVYTEEGAAQARELVDYYLGNARIIRSAVDKLGHACVGGINSPYIWVNAGTDSWEFFQQLLREAAVVCTPGTGFGTCGQGYIRISAFNSREKVEEAMERITRSLGT
jgi:LL-diaminopimelate aminotransferase